MVVLEGKAHNFGSVFLLFSPHTMSSPLSWSSHWWAVIFQTLGVGDGQGSLLQSMGLQRVGHNWATELNWSFNIQVQSLLFCEHFPDILLWLIISCTDFSSGTYNRLFHLISSVSPKLSIFPCYTSSPSCLLSISFNLMSSKLSLVWDTC